MKKTFLRSLVAVAIGSLVMVGSAFASTLPPSEWGIINPIKTTAVLSDFDSTNGPAFFIWTDDANRNQWNIAWKGSGTGAENVWQFQGAIELENSLGTFETFAYETTGHWIDEANLYSNGADFTAFSNSGYDGISFTRDSFTSPSYVGFDLLYRNANSNLAFSAMDSNFIFIGSDKQTVASLGEDQDFAIAAPVPEPATMLLFGTGLIGLAGVARRKKK